MVDDRLFNQFAERTYRKALGLVRNSGVSDGEEHDVLQTALFRFYRWLQSKKDQNDPQAHEALFWRMLLQVTLDVHRRRRKRPLPFTDLEDPTTNSVEAICGPDPGPDPETILLAREKEDQYLAFLQVVAEKCHPRRFFVALLRQVQGCSPSETVEWIECFLFGTGPNGDTPRKSVNRQLAHALGVAQNTVYVHRLRLRELWSQLKRELLGEEAPVRRRASNSRPVLA